MKIIDEDLYRDFYDYLFKAPFSKEEKELLAVFASISPFVNRCMKRIDLQNFTDSYVTFSYPSLVKEIESFIGEEESSFLKKTRQFKYRELLKIVIRDVNGINNIERTLEELTKLAEIIIVACCKFVEKTFSNNMSPLSVIAMGKLGAEELNFSSDVDIVYVFDSDELDIVETYNKKAAYVNKLLTAVTEDGFLYRVDNDLRPGGRFSPLAMSGEAIKNHYILFGETWQRVALLRARFLTGDEAFVNVLMEDLMPFIYRRYLDYSLIDDLRKLKERINKESMLKNESGINIKLGKGGIREAEFFVQVLQIINGGKYKSLRKVRFWEIVNALREKDILSANDASKLKDAYYFLRRLENSIQIEEERQEYYLPSNEKTYLRVVKRCGFDSIEDFIEQLNFYRNVISGHFDNLFEEKIRVVEKEITKEKIVDVVLSNVGEDRDFIAIAEKFYEMKKNVPVRYKESFLKFVFELIKRMVTAENSKVLLRNIDDFVKLLVRKSLYIPLIAENPQVIDKIFDILQMGSFFCKLLLTHPESLDFFIQSNDDIDRGNYQSYLKAIRKIIFGMEDFEEQMSVLRQFKNSEWLKIAMLNASLNIDNSKMELFLTNLSEAILTTVVQICDSHLRKKYKEINQEFVILGLGKLGTQEMNFHSDLDLIFLYRSNDEGAVYYNTKLLQRVISALSLPTKEGYLYKVDMRLRPTGSQGPLVTSFDSFVNYHNECSWLFEKQALSKARVLGEDCPLKRDVEREIEKIVYENTYEESYLKIEMKKMREKIEKEATTKLDNFIDIKAGQGGIIDIEFIIQYFKLKYGKDIKAFRTTNTEAFFNALKESSLLPSNKVELLREAYLFLKQIETALRMYAGYSKNLLALEENVIDEIAFFLDYKKTNKKNFLRDVTKTTKTVRQCFNEIFS